MDKEVENTQRTSLADILLFQLLNIPIHSLIFHLREVKLFSIRFFLPPQR